MITPTVTGAAVSKNFGAYQDAAVREAVFITKNGRPRTVLITYEDYLRLARRDRRDEATADLSDDDIAAVETSEMVLALVTALEDGTPVVRVLPITHTPPARADEAIEIPPSPKAASSNSPAPSDIGRRPGPIEPVMTSVLFTPAPVAHRAMSASASHQASRKFANRRPRPVSLCAKFSNFSGANLTAAGKRTA